MIELRHPRHLLAVAEQGNCSRTADAVHLTQPALSRSIQALEAEVGAASFERNRGAIEPTEIGRLLLRHARAMDASTRDLDREIRLTEGLELGELHTGVGPFGGCALIGPVVGRLNRLHPRRHVKLTVAVPVIRSRSSASRGLSMPSPTPRPARACGRMPRRPCCR